MIYTSSYKATHAASEVRAVTAPYVRETKPITEPLLLGHMARSDLTNPRSLVPEVDDSDFRPLSSDTLLGST